MRNLHERIDAINEHFIEMTKNVERLLRINMEMLKKRSFERSLYGEAKVVEDRINAYEVKIKEDSIVAIAMFQPAAGDLRSLLSTIEGSKMLERMGDLLLADLKLLREMEKKGDLHKPHLDLVGEMVGKVEEIFTAYTTALVEKDDKKIYSILALDEEINDIRDSVVKKVIELMKESPDNVEFGNLLLLSTKKYERISDKIMQLGRSLVYNVSGDNLRKQELIKKN
ncbi:phosphate transport system regulatory protein PhoU [Propionigenium maris DSM 9537]|uniref:Phosphate transport system regulatory protein PhoU n=1 Tax=Propionigenium maris DSM 9537 TaxID=1123000 RepID=A0A9W6LM09_9FUSO|nr:PhoU domain-containing protein [Propionigenium maris]GLI55846.1 phosphate transport system regulatory protein PhoU [Propionigenium maris DSM 9537]